METLKQSYVTKTNKKKGATTKHTNCSLKSGGSSKCDRIDAIPWCNTLIPHTPSQLELSSRQNHSQYIQPKRSVSALQYRASLTLSAPLSSAGLNSHCHSRSYGMSRTFLIVHKTSSQITTQLLEFVTLTAAEREESHRQSHLYHHQGSSTKVLCWAVETSDSSHPSNSLKGTWSLGT